LLEILPRLPKRLATLSGGKFPLRAVIYGKITKPTTTVLYEIIVSMFSSDATHRYTIINTVAKSLQILVAK
jgi:hypothetical protein